MALKHSYHLLAPIYDTIVANATMSMRAKSLQRLGDTCDEAILLMGVGTGLDFPLLPSGPSYTGIDITPAMLQKARNRLQPGLDITLDEGDVLNMPYAENHFDIVIMHLILAVVPDPQGALKEAERVVKPGGRILILDKFIRPGQVALMRRFINIFLRHIATRTDVVFERLLFHTPSLKLMSDETAMAGGWFRYIEVRKDHSNLDQDR